MNLDMGGDEVRVMFQAQTSADIDEFLQEISAWSEDP